MTTFILATSNRGKLVELKAFFQARAVPVKLLSPTDFSAPVPQVLEDGATYYENALKKAAGFQRAYGVPALADDSGLEVDALGGAPGVFSARYGGEGLDWPERWSRLLGELKGATDRRARFRCVLCYYDGQGAPWFFEGTVEGAIGEAPRGEGGFGYDPLFHCPELGKTFGEASAAEKDRISHRTRALERFLAALPSLDRNAPGSYS